MDNPELARAAVS